MDTIQVPQFRHKFSQMHRSLVGQNHKLEIPRHMMHEIWLKVVPHLKSPEYLEISIEFGEQIEGNLFPTIAISSL